MKDLMIDLRGQRVELTAVSYLRGWIAYYAERSIMRTAERERLLTSSGETLRLSFSAPHNRYPAVRR